MLQQAAVKFKVCLITVQQYFFWKFYMQELRACLVAEAIFGENVYSIDDLKGRIFRENLAKQVE